VSAIKLSGVVANYDEQPVLRGVDLEVPDGTVTAVLGSSGCGKTTLLKVIAGFLRPRSGDVWIGDRHVVGADTFVAPERRRVGLVPQEGLLFPHLDVAGNVGFALPRAKRATRVAELLELVGLPGTQRARPHELSGGMQQRVALARALAPNPDVVVLDEPFSALDVGLRAQVRSEVLSVLRSAGTTAVLVTHDQDEALSSADHVALLRDGQVVQAGTPQSVYEFPVDPGVAEFFGDCNVLAARRRTDGALECSLGTLPPTLPYDPVNQTLFLRPEHLRATERADGSASVFGLSYHGHDVLLHVRLADGSAVKSRMLAGSDVPAVGTPVELSIVGT
jgi:iron(III) transport system ATP-binding protein